jgi:anti-sigma regulatory factor (Ser/Thr protein kinase)
MDVKNTKEVIIALVKLGKEIAKAAKDGLDVKDVAAIGMKVATDEAFRNAFIAAFEGCSEIPAEIQDIKFEEGVELALAIVAELKAS